MDGKVCLRCKGKTLLGVVDKLKKFVDITQQCFALLPRVNFPGNNLNFYWRCRWWDRIQAIFLNLFYFNPDEAKLWSIRVYLVVVLWIFDNTFYIKVKTLKSLLATKVVVYGARAKKPLSAAGIEKYWYT